jgi:hypothetical protein
MREIRRDQMRIKSPDTMKLARHNVLNRIILGRPLPCLPTESMRIFRDFNYFPRKLFYDAQLPSPTQLLMPDARRFLP